MFAEKNDTWTDVTTQSTADYWWMNNQNNAKIGGRFSIKMIQNHLERFCEYISQFDSVNTCVLSIWDAFINSLRNPLKILRKNIFSHFSVKKIKHAYTKMATIFFAMFPAEQTSHSVDLNVQLNGKNTNKKYSKPCQVLSKFGGWIPDYSVSHNVASYSEVVNRDTIGTLGVYATCMLSYRQMYSTMLASRTEWKQYTTSCCKLVWLVSITTGVFAVLILPSRHDGRREHTVSKSIRRAFILSAVKCHTRGHTHVLWGVSSEGLVYTGPNVSDTSWLRLRY